MRTFGLTGGVASGKSVVAAHFAARAVAVLDADELAREAVLPGSVAWQQIRAHFGPQVFDASGALQRELLAQQVFGAPEQLATLGRIVHPQVAQLFSERARSLQEQGQAWLCYCVPLLFENHLQDSLRPVVLIAASIETQIARAKLRSGWTEEQTRARIAAQLPLSEKRKRADYVIENDGELSHTLNQADRVLDAIRARL